jgi:hypothetical protein
MTAEITLDRSSTHECLDVGSCRVRQGSGGGLTMVTAGDIVCPGCPRIFEQAEVRGVHTLDL